MSLYDNNIRSHLVSTRADVSGRCVGYLLAWLFSLKLLQPSTNTKYQNIKLRVSVSALQHANGTQSSKTLQFCPENTGMFLSKMKTIREQNI